MEERVPLCRVLIESQTSVIKQMIQDQISLYIEQRGSREYELITTHSHHIEIVSTDPHLLVHVGIYVGILLSERPGVIGF